MYDRIAPTPRFEIVEGGDPYPIEGVLDRVAVYGANAYPELLSTVRGVVEATSVANIGTPEPEAVSPVSGGTP